MMNTRASNRTLDGIFAEHAARTPSAVALVDREREVSYAELHERARAAAVSMRRLGVGSGSTVALAAGRSVDTIAAMLGVLQSSAAYLPLDLGSPPARHFACLERSRVRHVIHERGDTRFLTSGLVGLDMDTLAAAGAQAAAPQPEHDGESACYVMYTSGSTGAPKGVVVPHRAVERLVIDPNYIQLSSDDRVLQFAPLSFDASTFEIWGALLNGATLVLYPEPALDPNVFVRVLREQRITILWLTAGLFHALAAHVPHAFAGLRFLLAGGDVLQPKLVNKVLDSAPGLTVINGYGPTENTTFTCCHRMTTVNRPGDYVPIGRPISGTHVHVLDEDFRPTPVGEQGELFVSGRGVALGYVGCELDRSTFFRDAAIAPGLIYRTGDFVREHPGRELEFIGRKDNLVKVRGFRVALEEVQRALVALAKVDEALVVLRAAASGDGRLVAYVRTREHLTLSQLRGELAARLPPYMIPDEVHFVADLPVNHNGKIDRQRLS